MDISRAEQRVLHLLAQGGMIVAEKNDHKQIIDIRCFTRDGWVYSGCTMALFRKLKRRRTIASKGGGPYRITQLGLNRVRAQVDNRQMRYLPPGPPGGTLTLLPDIIVGCRASGLREYCRG